MATQDTADRAPIADDPPKDRSLSRRQMLGEGGALLGGAMISGVAAGQALAETPAPDKTNLPPNVPEWMKTPGANMGSQPYGMPSPYEKDVIKNISKTLPQYFLASGRTPIYRQNSCAVFGRD